MLNNYNSLNIEIDMLKGNINRMCVTDNIEELQKMFDVAKIRINEIYQYNVRRINA